MDKKGVAMLLIFIAAMAGIATAIGTWAELNGQVLRVGYLKNNINDLALIYAQNQNMFTASGLEMSFVQYDTEPEILDALAADQIDIGYVGLPAAIMANRNQGVPITVIAPVNEDGIAIVVMQGSGITNASDLADKTVAIPAANDTQDFMLRLFVSGSVVHIGHDILDNATNGLNTTLMVPGNMPAAMNASTIDAFVAQEMIPGASIYKPVYGSLGYSGSYLVNSSTIWPNHPCLVIVARTALVEDARYHDMLERFIQVHENATSFIQNPVNAGTVISVLETVLGLNKIDITYSLANTIFNDTPDVAGMNATVVKLTLLDMIQPIPDVLSYDASFYNMTFL
jgi:ABC-type nitrate/sulfonate/bicarbonate transport system substrate-binding protein